MSLLMNIRGYCEGGDETQLQLALEELLTRHVSSGQLAELGEGADGLLSYETHTKAIVYVILKLLTSAEFLSQHRRRALGLCESLFANGRFLGISEQDRVTLNLVSRHYAHVSSSASLADGLKAREHLTTLVTRLHPELIVDPDAKPDSSSTTPVIPQHVDLLSVMVAGKFYHEALQFVGRLDFARLQEGAGIRPVDVAMLCHLTGLTHLGVGDCAAALRAMRRAFLLPPSQGLLAVWVPCFKKAVLLDILVAQGKGRAPVVGNQRVAAELRLRCEEYLQFQALFVLRDRAQLGVLVSRAFDQFSGDRNFGLVKRCLNHLDSLIVCEFARTHLSVSLDTVARAVEKSPVEAAKLALSLISSGKLSAQIHEREGVITFLQPSADLPALEQQLVSRIERTLCAVDTFKRAERALLSDERVLFANSMASSRSEF